MTTANIRLELYIEGMRRAIKFCKANKLTLPSFYTLQELQQGLRCPKENIRQFALRVMPGAALVGANTGLYRDGHVFVNLPVTALPVAVPRMRSWSWPCWKTDRTAMGVVAHELGHYVEHILAKAGVLTQTHGEQWRALIASKAGRKPVSGYEPVPSEAFAESMRLFVLNPDLLRCAIPGRWQYLRSIGLKPSERRTWQQILASNPRYAQAAERWIVK